MHDIRMEDGCPHQQVGLHHPHHHGWLLLVLLPGLLQELVLRLRVCLRRVLQQPSLLGLRLLQS